MGKLLSEAYMNRLKASIVDCFTDFISIANTDREIIYYNPAAYKMIGYSPDEMHLIDSTAKLHAEGFDEFAASVIQPSVFKNGSWSGISAIRHRDGHTITVEMTVFPLYSESGEEYGTVAVIRDVNQLTQMNERLKKSSELFQKVLDSAGIGIVLINMETHTIEMVNRFTCGLLQMEAEEIIGNKCYNILCHRSPDICPHINERDQRVLVAERYLERKDGTQIPIIKTGTWITLDDKEYLVDTFVDISIQKELEKNLHDAVVAAEAANSSKSEFLSRMSHEMRTPLNAVIGMTQISEKATSVEKLRECIDTIRLSSNHLLQLINDILDLSKIEEGKLELNIESFSVQAMMKKIALLIEPKAEEKHIALHMEVDDHIPEALLGDSLRLSQVLLNFLSNAVKFTAEHRRIDLRVALERRAVGNATLRFAVTDQGIGISEEQLGRLFTPFVQADGSITRKYGGTGLGLVISKRLINLMGSDIDVRTEPGTGSTFAFSITLPLAEVDPAAPVAQAPAQSHDLFLGKRVLIVDDVDMNRMIAIELLSDTGLQFDEAANGEIAVKMATRQHYDVILMDIQMPVMDGYAATHAIRAVQAPYCDVPIIAMSANVFKEDVERSLREGMNGHVGKPIDTDKLVLTLDQLFHPAVAAPLTPAATSATRHAARLQTHEVDKRFFDYHQALARQGRDQQLLADHCETFLRAGWNSTIRAALTEKRYDTARTQLAELVHACEGLALTQLLSYAENVAACLARNEYQFAKMYCADMEKCYQATAALLSGLLQQAE